MADMTVPETFADLIRRCSISLPAEFLPPPWDPVPFLHEWNSSFSPHEGVPHWDGNAILGEERIVDLTLLPRESEMGADQVIVRVWPGSMITLTFMIGDVAHPLGEIKSSDELHGMLAGAPGIEILAP